jgi:hypothetical protein
LVLGLAGCGSDPAGQITGKVTENGAPVPNVEVVFRPLKESTRSFYGGTTATGEYRVDYEGREGLPPGHYVVTVRRHSLPGGRPLPDGELGANLVSEGKAVTQTFDFNAKVEDGTNAQDFELTRAKSKSQQGGK